MLIWLLSRLNEYNYFIFLLCCTNTVQSLMIDLNIQLFKSFIIWFYILNIGTQSIFYLYGITEEFQHFTSTTTLKLWQRPYNKFIIKFTNNVFGIINFVMAISYHPTCLKIKNKKNFYAKTTLVNNNTESNRAKQQHILISKHIQRIW